MTIVLAVAALVCAFDLLSHYRWTPATAAGSESRPQL